MFLEENIAKLNATIAPEGLEFREHGERYRLIEKKRYLLNNLPSLKENLKYNYKMRFDWDPDAMYWFIGNEGKKVLSQRAIKFEPSLTEAELRSNLEYYIEEISNAPLKTSLKTTLEANEFYYDAPASISYHHAYKHGLLEHSIQVTKLALSMKDCLDENTLIDEDIIISGSILHDIGKINCYQFIDGGIDACGILSEQNHLANGIKIISQHMVSCADLDHLIHILASHHRAKAFGAIVEPISNEAWIISVADDLSSKIQG